MSDGLDWLRDLAAAQGTELEAAERERAHSVERMLPALQRLIALSFESSREGEAVRRFLIGLYAAEPVALSNLIGLGMSARHDLALVFDSYLFGVGDLHRLVPNGRAVFERLARDGAR